jgi:hypothetical protein
MPNPYEHIEQRIHQRIKSYVDPKASAVKDAAYAYTAEVKVVADAANTQANAAYNYAAEVDAERLYTNNRLNFHYHSVSVSTTPSTVATEYPVFSV